MVVYYKDRDALQSVLYCIIPDDNKHDVGMIYQVQKEIITDLKLRFPYLALIQKQTDTNQCLTNTLTQCLADV